MRSTADGLVGTRPAPPLQQFLAVAERLEERMREDFGKRVPSDISDDLRGEELVGMHPASMIDGEDALARRVAAATSKDGLHV